MIKTKVIYKYKSNLHGSFNAEFPFLPRSGDLISTETMCLGNTNPLHEFGEVKVISVIFHPDRDFVSIKCVARHKLNKQSNNQIGETHRDY